MSDEIIQLFAIRCSTCGESILTCDCHVACGGYTCEFCGRGGCRCIDRIEAMVEETSIAMEA